MKITLDLNVISFFLGLIIAIGSVSAIIYKITIKPYQDLKNKTEQNEKNIIELKNELIEVKAEQKAMTNVNESFQIVTVKALQAICNSMNLNEINNDINDYLLNRQRKECD